MNTAVEDYVAIQQLMYHYASCADQKNYAGFKNVFCEDAVFDYSGRLVTPRSAIQEMMGALEKYTLTQHQIHNTVYDVEGDTATGETYCLASHLRESDSGLVKIDMGITYKDRLRRTPEGWRIQYRGFNLLWSQTAPVDQKQGILVPARVAGEAPGAGKSPGDNPVR